MIPTMLGGFIHLARLMPLLAQTCKEEGAEIIVVDNASRDGTCNYLSNYDLTIRVNKTNRGFSQAHNQAARIAQGEFLLLLNNDTVVKPGFITEMKRVFELDSKIGIVGCLIYTMDAPKKVQHAGVCFTPDYVPYELGLEIPSIAPGIPNNDPRVMSVREVPSVTAACMMVRRSVWEEVGGMDEEYKNGWEDNDFVLRVREKGYKVWYTGRTHIYHKHFGSIGRLAFEAQNRARFDALFVHNGRAKAILGNFIHG